MLGDPEPQIEQTAMFNALNFSYGCFNGDTYGGISNNTVSMARVAVFLCPSDTPPNYNANRLVGTAFIAPGNNYFASMGSSLSFTDSMIALILSCLLVR